MALLGGCIAVACTSSRQDTPTETGSDDELSAPLPPQSVVPQVWLQAVVDHEQIAPFLHLEVAENVPLQVHSVQGLAEGVSRVVAAGQPVRVTSVDEARIRFTELESLQEASERVHFEIPSEGVSGHVDLQLRDSVWEVTGASVVEQ